MKTKQQGYISFPSGFFGTLAALAFVGVISLLGTFVWFLWWIVTNIRFVG